METGWVTFYKGVQAIPGSTKCGNFSLTFFTLCRNSSIALALMRWYALGAHA